ncbi:VOC family protein [Sphingosinicella sp. GR2756]|uniref:VOC family protein n=1 Tax=Sphingosinicella rhizophila TaxID=3050082 RepID=A0ABU3Q9Y8_9SPHN|nr:VOC family protein [Sphingosinicella sp. GR2756]MDT9599755.1 VOC family protein [Sphingosinicella sp. GR2756]
MKQNLFPFHLAFPVHDITVARHFYGEVMGLPQGRSSDTWTDFDLFGHQIVVHLKPGMLRDGSSNHENPVDGKDVPVPHFGVVLDMTEHEALANRLRSKGVKFVIEPYVRFHGQVGEQATMFFLDPSGNALEFKAFADPTNLFAT